LKKDACKEGKVKKRHVTMKERRSASAISTGQRGQGGGDYFGGKKKNLFPKSEMMTARRGLKGVSGGRHDEETINYVPWRRHVVTTYTKTPPNKKDNQKQ